MILWLYLSIRSIWLPLSKVLIIWVPQFIILFFSPPHLSCMIHTKKELLFFQSNVSNFFFVTVNCISVFSIVGYWYLSWFAFFFRYISDFSIDVPDDAPGGFSLFFFSIRLLSIFCKSIQFPFVNELECAINMNLNYIIMSTFVSKKCSWRSRCRVV